MTTLPRGWIWSTIGEVCDINPRRFDEVPEDDELISKVPMAAVEEESGLLDPSHLVEYGGVKGKSLTPFQEGDVLFAKVTPCMENGKIALARDLYHGRAVGSTELFVLRSKGAIDPRYLMHFLLQKSVRSKAERAMTGAVGLRRVPRPFLARLQIPHPRIEVQQEIVADLEDHLSRICNGMNSLEKIAGTARNGESKKKGGLLVDLERSILDSVAWPSRPGEELPEGWHWGMLNELLADIEAGKSFRCEARPAAPDEWGVIKVSSMTWGRFDENQNKAIPFSREPDPRYEINPGDILVSRANTEQYVGAPVLVEECRPRLLLSDKSLRLKPHPGVDPQWLFCVLSSPRIRAEISSRATGTKDSMRNISQKSLKSIQVPIPPDAEQRNIAFKVANSLTRAAELGRTVLRLSEDAENLRDATMEAAFSGQLLSHSETRE